MPLIFDTMVLILTIYKTLSVVRSGAAGSIVLTFVRDGVLYYLSVNASPICSLDADINARIQGHFLCEPGVCDHACVSPGKWSTHQTFLVNSTNSHLRLLQDGIKDIAAQ